MKYSEFLSNLIGKEGLLYNLELPIIIDMTPNIKDRNIKIIDVGDDYVIIEYINSNFKGEKAIPLNLLIIHSDFLYLKHI